MQYWIANLVLAMLNQAVESVLSPCWVRAVVTFSQSYSKSGIALQILRTGLCSYPSGHFCSTSKFSSSPSSSSCQRKNILSSKKNSDEKWNAQKTLEFKTFISMRKYLLHLARWQVSWCCCCVISQPFWRIWDLGKDSLNYFVKDESDFPWTFL